MSVKMLKRKALEMFIAAIVSFRVYWYFV